MPINATTDTNIYRLFQHQLQALLKDLVQQKHLPADLMIEKAFFEPPRDEKHGDLATTAAMTLAGSSGMKPHALASLLKAGIERWDSVESVHIAGPGFINLRLSPAFWQNYLKTVLMIEGNFDQSLMGKGMKINIEYVSANPTGPLHIGHVRGAVIGDVLANMFERMGYDVTREYYVNDAGSQVDNLARSVYLRYCEAQGQDIRIPENLYPGDYLVPRGEILSLEKGETWLDQPEVTWLASVREQTIKAMLDLIKKDLKRMRIRQHFVSENDLVTSGKVQELLDKLHAGGLIYRGQLPPPKGKRDEDWEPRDQQLLRTTAYGDSQDRALIKSDGSFTYYTTDLAYHLDKIQRGADLILDIWGADHHGHVGRMTAGIQAVLATNSMDKTAGIQAVLATNSMDKQANGTKKEKENQTAFDVLLCNLVKLMRDGQELKMSKRAGTLVPLSDLLDEVGPDAIRFMILTRRHTENLNFDLKKAIEKSLDNPLFYVQYAHARIQSVERRAQALFGDLLLLDNANFGSIDYCILKSREELAAIRKVAAWPRLLETATLVREPHRLVFFLMEVAAGFHSLWASGRGEDSLRFIVESDLAVTRARLALLMGIRKVLRSGLGLIGVVPLSEM